MNIQLGGVEQAHPRMRLLLGRVALLVGTVARGVCSSRAALVKVSMTWSQAAGSFHCNSPMGGWVFALAAAHPGRDLHTCVCDLLEIVYAYLITSNKYPSA